MRRPPYHAKDRRLGTTRHAVWLWGILASAAAMAGGCHRQPLGADSKSPQAATPADAQEIWDVFYLEGAKIGYGRTQVRRPSRDGRELVAVDSLNHLSIERFGQRVEQELRLSTLETTAGALVEFETQMALGPSPARTRGRIAGDELLLTVDTKGRSETARLPWSNDIGGFRAVEQSLEAKPLAPGETRRLRMLVPLVNQVAEVRLAAAALETTQLLGTAARLLRIESVADLPGGQTLKSTLWTDSRGTTLKTRIDALGQESFRTTRAVATAAGDGRSFDLGSDLIVRIDPPLANPHQTRRVKYRVQLADGDPAKLLARGPTQHVEPLDEHTALVTVERLDPKSLPAGNEPEPGPDYRLANSVLQIDDPKVAAMAREAAETSARPAEQAVALERYVHDAMTNRNFSQAFSTAAEVAQSREGDCTEHAVLLAALARARGIPSRVAIGLVYVQGASGFGYHMWTEVYVAGQWLPLDAILGQGGIGAAHIKLTDANLEGPAAYSSFLTVAQVVGKLKIEVLDAE